MKMLAGLFTLDADFVNVNGHFWKGRDEIEKNHAAPHAMMFKESVWTTVGTRVRFLGPGVAPVHVKWARSEAIRIQTAHHSRHEKDSLRTFSSNKARVG
jgi:uncharacterized protein (TIGR02246 family)